MSSGPWVMIGFGLPDVAPRDRADPGGQLGEIEGLHEVVVGAGVQPLDPVRDLIERRQDDHRRHVAPGAQAS